MGALESIGIPKRDLMVYRVEKARDVQEEVKEQFKTALEKFTALTNFQGGSLESKYAQLNDEYLTSEEKAQEVRKHIDDIKDVSDALFEEWEQELEQYKSASLKSKSKRTLSATRVQYKELVRSMDNAEAKIAPVLAVFNDQVLYLKHNLNAKAIASLQGELDSVESDVSQLIEAMEKSINEANSFIEKIESAKKS